MGSEPSLAVITCVGCAMHYSAPPWRPDRTGVCCRCAPDLIAGLNPDEQARLTETFGKRGVHWDVPRNWWPLVGLLLLWPVLYWFLFQVFKTGPAPQ